MSQYLCGRKLVVLECEFETICRYIIYICIRKIYFLIQIFMNKVIKSLLLSFSAMLFVISASAQVTTSALNGIVADQNGEAIPGATVVAVHTPSGTTYYAVANAEGRFAINGMRTGGPYSVEVSCLGYQTVTYTDITLQLADSYQLTANLAEDNEMLSEAIVVSAASTRLFTEKSGVATNISNEQMTALPTVSRSITDITKLSPYGGNGMTFGGTDGRTANFTVDGANFNNNFGLSDGLPGGGSPISLDAIEELQVVISPYDVRQTNFIGGGVNAITKSGTNTFKGSAYVYHRNENLRGDTVEGEQIAGARDRDRNTTYGFTLGGPIMKDKLFFFVNFEYAKTPTVVNRWRASEDGVYDADNNISRTTYADMQKVSEHLMQNYGYDTGSWTDYPADESNMKMLARIDWNITDKHRLAVRYNYTLNQGWNSTNGSSSDCDPRQTGNRLSEWSMAFANSMYSMDNIVHTVSVDLNSNLTDRLSNQLLVTYSLLDDVRGTNSSKFPFIDIMKNEELDGTPSPVGTLHPYISAGYELFTWNNGVHNRVFTVKDDLTYFVGNHKIVAGLSYEYQMADNSYMRQGTGYYRYNSLDDFLNQRAPETVLLSYGYDGEQNPAARVRYHKASLYAQDDWDVTDNFKLTYGLRLETILFDNQDLMTNKAIKDLDYGGTHIDTGYWPKPQIQVSPRIGFTWDVLGNNRLTLRGGTGLFTGRLPLVFFTNMPTQSGMVQNLVGLRTSYDGGVAAPDPLLANFAGPMITTTEGLLARLNGLDSGRFPLSITPEDGVLPEYIAAVDPKFKMPQVWKSSIAVDYNVPTPFPFTISGEFIYNKTVNATVMTDLNVKPVEGFPSLNGADNRHIFPGDHSYYNDVSAFWLTNTNQGYGYMASLSLNMQPVRGLDIMAAYTHSASKEVTDLPGNNAESVLNYLPTVEGVTRIGLHNAANVTPDRFFLSLNYSDKGNNTYSLFYETWRGGYKYSYMTVNDINMDGYNYDSVYIPTDVQIDDPSQIRFASDDDKARFWAYVNNDPYLSAHKGEYAEPYSVYSPWVHRLDFRFTHDFKVKIGSSTNTLQLSLDIKNILNMFNSSWGVSKYMNPDLNSGRILSLKEIADDGVPVYTTPSAVNGSVEKWVYNHDIGQCWYAQIGLKYMFN